LRRAYAAGLEATAARCRLMKLPQDWKRPFDDPIPLPLGRQIVTLRDAAEYARSLPKAEQDPEEWQAAVEALLLVIELNGPTMTARIDFQ
jgi:hypothetical protein